MVSIPACHTEEWGLKPRQGEVFFLILHLHQPFTLSLNHDFIFHSQNMNHMSIEAIITKITSIFLLGLIHGKRILHPYPNQCTSLKVECLFEL